MTPGIFPFLQLATEIRLLIYDLVLPYSENRIGSDNRNPTIWHPGKCPNILYVNRQIHQETTELLYHNNVFTIYVKHPRQPRLPMNESRADPETFLLISWVHRNWAHPKNPKLPISMLKNHSKFQDFRRIHVFIPSFGDLLGVDVYIQGSCYAAHRGINAWVAECAKNGGFVDPKDSERMAYVQQFKGPIDELALSLQTLPKIDYLYLHLEKSERDISFDYFMMQRLLALDNVEHMHPFESMMGTRHYLHCLRIRPMMTLTTSQETGASRNPKFQLPPDMDEMFWLLHSVKARQHWDLETVPIWVHPMKD